MINASRNPNANYWHDAGIEMALGCTNCETLATCGGLRMLDPTFDCSHYCRCTGKEATASCPLVCPCNPETFVARIREVDSLDLATVPSAAATAPLSLPLVAPLLYHGGKRRTRLQTRAVALPLEKLFSKATGRPRFLHRRNLLDRFRVSSRAALIISGVAQDRSLEAYWSVGRATGLPDLLSLLAPALITTPNFSLFGDVPRWDNLYNMKRIAICWQELAQSGVPTALHVNARTDHDWDRWGEFLRSHPEITAIAFEFKTGPASPDRGRWHAQHLCRLADSVARSLHLITRGGCAHLRDLARSFKAITLIASTPSMKTVKRRRLVWRGLERPRWAPLLLPRHHPLDDLLQYNVDEYARMVASLYMRSTTHRGVLPQRPAARQLELPLVPSTL